MGHVSFRHKNLNLKEMKEDVVTSIYFSEIPDYSKSKEMFDVFGCIGKVVEVSISSRKNNIGKRFGYARFVNMEDERMLAGRLDNVIIVGKKIHANLPQFQRNNLGQAWNSKGGFKGKEKADDFINYHEGKKGLRGDYQSFAKVVSNNMG